MHNFGVEYRKLSTCFKLTVKREGLKALYRGMGINLIKTVPSCALTFVTFENISRVLGDYVSEERER